MKTSAKRSAKLALVALLLANNGSCFGGGEHPVLTPIREPCVNRADVPPATPPAGPLPEDARQASDLLGAIVLQLRGEVRTLRALIEPCTR